jgi:hypothetical protein
LIDVPREGGAFGVCAARRRVFARACRGDARVCAGLVSDWLELLDIEKRARRSFADIERPLATPDELRAYRAWRKALEGLC